MLIINFVLTFIISKLKRWGAKKGEFKAYWSTPEDFQNILISNLMLRDHYPDALIGALGSLLPHDGEEVQHHVIGEDGEVDRTPTDRGSVSINVDLSGTLGTFSFNCHVLNFFGQFLVSVVQLRISLT